MIAVIIRACAVSPNVVPEVCRLLVQTIARTQTPGWIHGRCLVDTTDCRYVLVYEEWASRQGWDAWYNSEARFHLVRELIPFQEGDLHIDIYEEV
jgi:quinol monooxygenase YgiN